MKKQTLKATLLSVLLTSALAGTLFVNSATANFMQVQLPVITIGSDGTVDPIAVPINKTGNIYTLTGDINGYSLDINCSNVIIDGKGFTLQTEQVSQNTAVIIEADGVTIKNLQIHGYYVVGVYMGGSLTTLTKNNISTTMGTSIKLLSDNNSITGNVIGTSGLGIDLTGKYNNITGNIIQNGGGSIWIELDSACFNKIIGNNMSTRGQPLITLEAKPEYDANKQQASSNVFCLNNFAVRNLYFDPIDFREGAKSIASYDLHVFDNGSVGNFWNDYGGIDADNDGLGDKPYVIAGKICDHYPLMASYDPENFKVVFKTSTDPFPAATIAIVSGISATAIAAIGLLFYFKKRKH